MVSTLSCIVNGFYTSCYRLNSFSRNGFLLNVRNLGISQLGFPRNGGNNLFCSRKICSLKAVEKSVNLVEQDLEKHSFAASYLVDTCGFSPEEAVALAKRLNKARFNTRDRPDFVLAVLKKYGFDDTHITKAIRQDPTVLVCKPEKRLIPKFEFFRSLGLPDSEMADLMTCSHPNMLRRSLKGQIIPCYDLLKSVLVDDAKVIDAFKGYSRVFMNDVKQRLVPNVQALRQAGVSESMISFALFNYFPLFRKPRDQFSAGVDEAIRLGFDPSQLTFVQALPVLIRMSKSTIRSKVEQFKQWGFSDAQIADISRKYPISMCSSKEKIAGIIDYVINEMGYKPSDIASCPSVLCCSLQKRIIPRWSVVRVLQMKGLLGADIRLSSFLVRPDKVFLEKFVTKYVEHVPQLMSVYQGRVGIQELGLRPEDFKVSPCLTLHGEEETS